MNDARPGRKSPCWLRSMSILVASLVVGNFVFLWCLGDVYWLGTIALFAPRWPIGLPVAALGLAVLAAREWKSGVWVLALSGVVLGPLLGFRIPTGAAPGDPRESLRVLTVNMGGGGSAERLRRVVEEHRPHVVAIQECPVEVPEAVFDSDDGWVWERAAGLCLASRLPIGEFEILPASAVGSWGNLAMRAHVTTGAGRVCVVCLHLETPRKGFEELHLTRWGVAGIARVDDNTRFRNAESKFVRAWVDEVDGPKVVAGDFNTPVESRIYARHWSDFRNAFSERGFGFGHTKLTRWHGVRIDHVLCTESVVVRNCRVGPSSGGDHRMVFAEVTTGR